MKFMPLLLCAGAVLAQTPSTVRPELDCEGDQRRGRGASHCEMKEWTLPAAARVSVDARQNGGVSVRGMDRADILVRAQVRAWAPTDGEARALAGQVRIDTGAEIRAEGPARERDRGWSVSYELLVPRRLDLNLKTTNGGIAVSDVNGRLEFAAVNGGVSLKRLAGHVSGNTTNGGISVELAGSRWDGDEMDVRTTNGGVSLKVPSDYSGRLEAGTVNGRVAIDFPVTIQGEISRKVSVTLGSGGPLIRAMTTNGGISVKRL